MSWNMVREAYTGNYTSFQNQKQQDLIRQQQMYNRQQKEIERLEGLIERFRYKATKAAMAPVEDQSAGTDGEDRRPAEKRY